MSSAEAVFTAGLRTPFTQAGKGAFKDTRPDDLLIKLFDSSKTKFPELWAGGPVDDVIAGCAYPEGEQGYNIARVAALGAGLESPGITVNRLCASSLDAVILAAASVKSGFGKKYLAAGVESMSRVSRRGTGFSESEFVKSRAPKAYITMGGTAEELCARYPGITRREQEKFAARSHELAFKAREQGLYEDLRDEGIRYPVNMEKIASLKPAFKEGGIVTAATSSPLSDGAASGFVLSADEAAKAGVKDGLLILDAAAGHVAPEVMGLGPVPAVSKLMKRNSLGWKDIAALEMNEAFAIQVLACQKELGFDTDIMNAWGGALALGHPLGASGLRLMITLHARLRALGKNGAKGIATLCVGGGQGSALLAEYRKF